MKRKIQTEYPARLERLTCPLCAVMRPFLLLGAQAVADIPDAARCCANLMTCHKRQREAIAELLRLREKQSQWGAQVRKLRAAVDDWSEDVW